MAEKRMRRFPVPGKFISYFSTHLVDEVIAKCRNELANKPNDPELFRTIGQAYFKKGNHQEALAAFVDAARLKPRDAGIQLAVGRCHELLGQLSEAERAFSNALDLEPGWPDTHYFVGKIHLAAGRIVEAKRELQAAIERNPRFRDALYSLALACEREENWAETIAILKKIIAMPGLPDKSRNPFPYDLETLFDDPLLLDEAIRQLEAAINQYPNFADLHYKLAMAFRRKGQKEPALEHFRKALSLNPNFHLARHYYWHWDDDSDPRQGKQP